MVARVKPMSTRFSSSSARRRSRAAPPSRRTGRPTARARSTPCSAPRTDAGAGGNRLAPRLRPAPAFIGRLRPAGRDALGAAIGKVAGDHIGDEKETHRADDPGENPQHELHHALRFVLGSGRRSKKVLSPAPNVRGSLKPDVVNAWLKRRRFAAKARLA